MCPINKVYFCTLLVTKIHPIIWLICCVFVWEKSWDNEKIERKLNSGGPCAISRPWANFQGSWPLPTQMPLLSLSLSPSLPLHWPRRQARLNAIGILNGCTHRPTEEPLDTRSTTKTMLHVASCAGGSLAAFKYVVSPPSKLHFSQIRYQISCFFELFPMVPHLSHLEIVCEYRFEHSQFCIVPTKLWN